MKKVTRIILAAAITLVVAAIGFYITLPALNVYSQEFWMALIFLMVIYSVAYLLLGARSGMKMSDVFSGIKFLKVTAIAVAVPVVVLIVGNILSSTFLNAEKYANIIEVPDAVFEEDMPESELVTNIALMDTASASVFAQSKLGNLVDLVSQYQVGTNYAQINYNHVPEKLVSLEYGDFFKWLNNRAVGVPGVIMVDPVDSEARYVELTTPIKYTDSAYFNEDLTRKLRFSYPTKIFGNISFEVDENGNPYYIVACMSPKISMFGAMDVNEVIIFNPCDGSSELYALADVPSWVDNVFTGDLASQKYDWYGTLKNGFWNSIIGNKECKVTTDDFGYIVIGDDVWFFTGVTSVSNDESNIGFIISNARTGEYKFYTVNGATEYYAMNAAQGEVQAQGYIASFPSLINVSGEATYIMVLKDDNDILKQYALVNVENYSIVTTGDSQEAAKAKYIELLVAKGIIEPVTPTPDPEPTPDDLRYDEIKVKKIYLATVGGESYAYIVGENNILYKQAIAKDETVMLISEGDTVIIKCAPTENASICNIASWSFPEPVENQ